MKRFLSTWLLAAFAVLGAASAFAGPVTFRKNIAPPSCSTAGSTFSVKGTAKYNGYCGNQIKIYTGGGCSGGTTTWQGSDLSCQSNSYQPTLTMGAVGSGACTVSYEVKDNKPWGPNGDEGTVFTDTVKHCQTITVTTAAPASSSYGATFGVAATASSGLGVSIAGSGGCSGSGTGSATITMGNGTCTVTYSQAGNANYSAAVDVTSSTSVGVDHIEIAHDGAAIGGVAETITVKACVNSGTGACVQYTGSQAITLSTTAGTFASTGTSSVTIAAFTGSTTQSLTASIGSSATLSVSSPTPATSAVYTCNSGGSIAASPSANCTLGYGNDHFQISQVDGSSVAADGTSSKTITLSSCANDRSTACSVLASDNRTVTLSNLGAGTLSSTSVTLVGGVGSVTLTGTSAGTAQLKITAPAAAKGYTCTKGGASGAQTLGSDSEATCQVTLTAPALHHFQISQASTATLAADGTTTKTVTVKACGDLGTTCNALATGTASVTITSSLAGTGSSTVYAPLALTGGQATFALRSNAAGTTTLATSTGSYRCSTDGGSTTVAGGAVAQCQMIFTVGALHHYQISQADSASVAVGTGSKTITVKACADLGTTCNALATGEASVVVTSSLAGTTGNLLGLGPGNTVNFTAGVGSFSISSALTVGTTTLATSSGSFRCSNDGGATSVAGGAVAECRVTFAGSAITRYLISQANTSMINDSGSSWKIITIKACTDAGATCNTQPAGSSTVTVLSSLAGTTMTPSGAPLTLTNGVGTFALSSTQSGFTYLSIDSPPVGGYLCSTDGGATLATGGASVTACRVGILVADNGFKGPGIYSAIKTNWRRLGWSSCNILSRDCAQTYDKSKFWVTQNPVGGAMLNKLVGSSSNPNKLWVVEASAYAGAYTIKDYYKDRCTALGTGGRELADADASLRISSAGYLIYRTCDSTATEQQWLIQSSTAGDAVDGVRMKTIPTVGYLDSQLCWSDPVYTWPVTELYVRNAVYGCGDWQNVFFFGGSNVSSPMYVHITHAESASVCDDSTTVSVQVCADAACTTGYPGASVINLSASGNGDNTPAWVGGNSLVFGGGSTAAQTLQLRDANAESVILDVSSPTDAIVSCSGDCVVDFLAEGRVSLSVPAFYAHKGGTATLTARKVDDSGACVPLLSDGNQTINFWANYESPSAAPASGTVSVVVNGTAVTTQDKAAAAPAGTDVEVSFSNGVASFPVNYDDAGTMQLNATAQQITPVQTRSAQFSVVPAGFCVTTTPATACASGTAPGAGCNAFTKAAGESFALKVQAVAWASDADSSYCDNILTKNFSQTGVNLSLELVAPSLPDGGTNGTLGTATIDLQNDAANLGSGTVNQSVSEVGIFNIKAAGTAIAGLSIPQVQAGTQASQGQQIGRFVPKKLDVQAVGTPELDDAGVTAGCGFSYSDTDFGFVSAPASKAPVIKITPKNANGDVTRNYRVGSFMRLDETMPHSYVGQSVTAAADCGSQRWPHARRDPGGVRPQQRGGRQPAGRAGRHPALHPRRRGRWSRRPLRRERYPALHRRPAHGRGWREASGRREQRGGAGRAGHHRHQHPPRSGGDAQPARGRHRHRPAAGDAGLLDGQRVARQHRRHLHQHRRLHRGADLQRHAGGFRSGHQSHRAGGGCGPRGCGLAERRGRQRRHRHQPGQHPRPPAPGGRPRALGHCHL